MAFSRKNVLSYHRMQIMIYVVVVMINVLQVHGQTLVNLTMVKDAVAKGAVCLDGSPAAYYYDPGYGRGANNWMVNLMGGGWCDTEANCMLRSTLTMNTINMPHSMSFPGILSPREDINPYFYNWHRIYVGYCDGGSFSADVEEVDPKTKLHFRGARIFRAVMDEFLAKGMMNASNAMLTGGSAGGLSTVLKCDEFRALLPNVPRVKCFVDAGVFFRGQGLPGSNVLREKYYWDTVQTHGLAKKLPKSCTSKMDPHLCMFAENLVGDIKTPIFLLQSAFDGWQLDYQVQHQPPHWINCTKLQLPCNQQQVAVLKDFRKKTLEAFNMMGPSSSRGLFITSCYYHTYTNMNERWNGHMLKHKTVSRAVRDWYYDKRPFQEIENNDFIVDCDVE